MEMKEKVKVAKYFSSDLDRSKVVLELIQSCGDLGDNSFIGRTLMNVVKEDEYKVLATKDLSEFSLMLVLMASNEYPKLMITQRFLRKVLDKFLVEEEFSCYDYFHQIKDLEYDEDIKSNIDKEGKLIVEKYFDKLTEDYDKNKVGTLKRATNELSEKFEHLRPFEVYENTIHHQYVLML